MPAQARHRLQAAAALALAATILSACAGTPGTSSAIHFRVDADAARKVSTLTCTASTSNECVIWIGDPQAPAHKTVRIAAGASVTLPTEDFGARYCADTVADHMAWPDCTSSMHGGALDTSHKGDYVSF